MTHGDSAEIHTDPVEQPLAAGSPNSVRMGRKRDPTRDAEILDAALEVLAEVGYRSMTMDMVAVRARSGKATVYRRWRSKEDLVLDAVARIKQGAGELDQLPDTGSLRGDLVSLIRPKTLAEEEKKLKVMAGLASLLSQHPEFSGVISDAINQPWVDVNRALMQRAVQRGEIAADIDIDTASRVIPSMATYRFLVERKSVDREFLLSLIDGIVLPAVRSVTERSSKAP